MTTATCQAMLLSKVQSRVHLVPRSSCQAMLLGTVQGIARHGAARLMDVSSSREGGKPSPILSISINTSTAKASTATMPTDNFPRSFAHMQSNADAQHEHEESLRSPNHSQNLNLHVASPDGTVPQAGQQRVRLSGGSSRRGVVSLVLASIIA